MAVLVKLIKELGQALSLTSVVVSHDVQEVLSIADYAYVIAEGRVIGAGDSQELLSAPSPMLQQFLQGQADGPVAFHYPAEDYQKELLEE